MPLGVVTTDPARSGDGDTKGFHIIGTRESEPTEARSLRLSALLSSCLGFTDFLLDAFSTTISLPAQFPLPHTAFTGHDESLWKR